MSYIFILLIKLYRLTLSPFVGRWCRYEPTCSCYGIAAIEIHGWWFGGWMLLARLLRCNPWGCAGYDPVIEELPPKISVFTPWKACDFLGKRIKIKR